MEQKRGNRLKNEQNHIIKRQSYEIVLDNASNAHHYQSKVSRLQKDKINKALDRVMNTYGALEYLDRYPDIILDIGTVSAIEFETILDHKIEEAFIYFLKGNIDSNGTLKEGERILLYKKYLEQLEFFLEFGYLRWDSTVSLKPSEIIGLLIRSNTKELILLLQKHAKNIRIQKRLVQQLNASLFEKIVLSSSPKNGKYMVWCCAYFMDTRQKWIQVNSKYFKEFLYERVLAYMLKEDSSNSGNYDFFKYILQHLTEHFKINYRYLFDEIERGAYSDHFKSDIEKLNADLYGKTSENVAEQKYEQLQIDDGSRTEFLHKLKYYLKYHKFANKKRDDLAKKLYARLQRLIEQKAVEFFVFFDELCQDKYAFQNFIQYFPDVILNAIVDQSIHKAVVDLRVFLDRLVAVSTSLKIKSRTLSAIQRQRGKILLNSGYRTERIDLKQEGREFLVNVMRYTSIDFQFITLLNIVSKETKDTLVKNSPSLSKMFVVPEKSKEKLVETSKLKKNASFLKFSKIIYRFYKSRQTIALIVFREELIRKKYLLDTLNLTVHLLDIHSHSSKHTKENMALWMRQRISELSEKGKDTVKIGSQIKDLVRELRVDDIIYDMLLQSFRNSGSTKENTVKGNLDLCIDELLAEITKYSSEACMDRLHQKITAFAGEQGKETTSILALLRKRLRETNQNVILSELVDEIVLDSKVITTPKPIAIFFKRDLVNFVCKQGRLPWWAEDISTSKTQEFFQHMAATYPDQIRQWYAQSTHKTTILEFLGDNVYQIFHVNTTAFMAAHLIGIQEIVYKLLHGDVAGIRYTNGKEKKELRFLLVECLRTNQGKSSDFLLKEILERTSNWIGIKSEDLEMLLYEKIQAEIDSLKREKWKAWINQHPQSLELPSKKGASVLKLMLEEESWEQTGTHSSHGQIEAALHEIYRRSPQELHILLKKEIFRTGLIKIMKPSAQIHLIKLFLDAPTQPYLEATLCIFEQIRTGCQPEEYKTARNSFSMSALLAIGIDHTISSDVRIWGRLVQHSLVGIEEETKKKVLVNEFLDIDEPKVARIVRELQRLLNDTTTLKKVEKRTLEETKMEQIGTSIHVGNAGLVILIPYIPMLFERLNLLDNNKFKDETSIQKGIDSLQYAVTGAQYSEEYALVLNKIICGKPIHEPLYTSVPLTTSEKEIINSMLNAVIQRWDVLGNTSIAGLRETFLNRDGSIHIDANTYTLHVEVKAFDMLLNQIPWNIKTLKLSWMHKLLEVIWK